MEKDLRSEKEKIYDEQISPLLKQVIEICKEHKIPMIANFGFDPVPELSKEDQDLVDDGDICMPADSSHTCLLGEEYDYHWVYEHMNVLHQCRTYNKSVNIDKYFFWLIKEIEKRGGHSSLFLNKMGVSVSTGKVVEEQW